MTPRLLTRVRIRILWRVWGIYSPTWGSGWPTLGEWINPWQRQRAAGLRTPFDGWDKLLITLWITVGVGLVAAIAGVILSVS